MASLEVADATLAALTQATIVCYDIHISKSEDADLTERHPA